MTGMQAGQNFHENRAKFDQKSPFNIVHAPGDRYSACFPMQEYGARRSDRWWERAEGKQVVVVVGEGREKSRHKKYSHGTVGFMPTVTQDLHGGRNALSAGDTRRSDIDSNVECESNLKKNRLLQLFVKSEKQFCSQKLLLRYSRALVDLQDTHVDGVRSSLAGARKDQV